MPPARSLALLLACALLGACKLSLPSPATPAADRIAVGALQGDGARSPHAGDTVTIEATVTGAFGDGLGGWFVQDHGDGDPRTSDAVFVFADGATALERGMRVRVRGEVVEHGDGDGDATLTALRPQSIEILDAAAPALQPTRLTAAPDDWEPLEGMWVRIDAPLTVSGQQDLTRRGTLVASFDGRLFTPTELAAPGPAAAAVAADNARRRVLLDDGSAETPEAGIWYLPGDAAPLRSGSVVTAAEGIVDQRWGDYRLQLTAPLRVQPAPRPAAPAVAGDVRIAAFNLENLFNGDGRGGGFPTARGARTPAEYQRQLAALVATIAALDADVAALMELENDGYDARSSIAQLVDALNAAGPAHDWRFVHAGEGPGTDAIRVGLLYRQTRVRPQGAPTTLGGGPFGERSRVPLAQAFVPLRDGRADGLDFTIVAVHFKSKGCSEATGADRDQGDDQACWNATRTESARRLRDWLAGDPTGAGTRTAIVGDFNAYAMEDPIRVFTDAGWRDPFDGHDPADRYSFVFDGQAGRLDHLLLSPALAARVAGAAKWHSNADESPAAGRRGDGTGAAPWRSSDHDPLLVGLRLRTD
ncbi:ExeM/NucH family extracellular endonuclease [Luteimonas sp. BDR2-5]|uniref:ExeM/NucH family extracellular endonuclease n=1 Tax=Proluteimonas luteida TaxID=2878685 RepID=UPI001E503242|nr:ExeM/NucH family extracellular endonuclease [Luteimonas sp. BDR2-5]MCD9029552.1 ExeM/NucH family extracellular endonuclease [Luteimonas sp. BDR2-5]